MGKKIINEIEDIKHEIKVELQKCFEIFYFSISGHKNAKEYHKDIDDNFQAINDLMEISEDVDLKVKFVYKLVNGEVKHTRYQPIQLYVENGADIVGDVESLYAQVKAVIRKNKHLLESSAEKPFFKSEEFIIKENAKSKEAMAKVEAIKRNESNGVVVALQQFQEYSGNRIRFDANQSLEV